MSDVIAVYGDGDWVVTVDGVAYRHTSRREAEGYARRSSKALHAKIDVMREGHPGYPILVYSAWDGRGRKQDES